MQMPRAVSDGVSGLGMVAYANYNTPIFVDMGAHMKTTIEVSDALFHSAKDLAQQSHTTMRALVEEGLRRVISDAQTKAKSSFKLKDARVHGKAVLMSDPRDWQKLEEEQVIARMMKTSR